MSSVDCHKVIDLCNLTIAGIHHRIRNAPVESPVNRQVARVLIKSLQQTRDSGNSMSQMIRRFASLLTTINSQDFGNIGFTPLEPKVCTQRYSLLGWAFDTAIYDWWFFTGQHQQVGYTFVVFRLPVCPPGTKGMKRKAFKQNAQLYTICGGIGMRNGKWYTLPWQPVLGNYEESSGGSIVGFQATDLSPTDSLKSFQMSISSGTIVVLTEWLDPETNQPVVFNAELIPTSAPSDNGVDACAPCFSGLGSIYWSLPLMNSSVSVVLPGVSVALGDTPGVVSGQPGIVSGPRQQIIDRNGIGWFDRQWITNGIAKNMITQSFLTVSKRATKQGPSRWTWLALQLQDGRQFSLSVAWTPKNWPFQINTPYPITGSIRFTQRGKSPVYYLQGTLAVLQTKTLPFNITSSNGDAYKFSIDFPTVYRVRLTDPILNKDEDWIVQSSFGDSIVYIFSGTPNWEGPGTVKDFKTGQDIGLGFLEYNIGMSNQDLLSVSSLLSGISPQDSALFSPDRKPSWPRTIGNGVILVLLPVVIAAVIVLVLRCLWRLYKCRQSQ